MKQSDMDESAVHVIQTRDKRLVISHTGDICAFDVDSFESKFRIQHRFSSCYSPAESIPVETDSSHISSSLMESESTHFFPPSPLSASSNEGETPQRFVRCLCRDMYTCLPLSSADDDSVATLDEIIPDFKSSSEADIQWLVVAEQGWTTSVKPSVVCEADLMEFFAPLSNFCSPQLSGAAGAKRCIERKLYRACERAGGFWDVDGCDVPSSLARGEVVKGMWRVRACDFYQHFEVVCSPYTTQFPGDDKDLAAQFAALQSASLVGLVDPLCFTDCSSNDDMDVLTLASHRLSLSQEGRHSSISDNDRLRHRKPTPRLSTVTPSKARPSYKAKERVVAATQTAAGRWLPDDSNADSEAEIFTGRSQSNISISDSTVNNKGYNIGYDQVYRDNSEQDGHDVVAHSQSPIGSPSMRHHHTRTKSDLILGLKYCGTDKPTVKGESILWSGYLEKKGGRGLRSTWKRRWFELDGQNLTSGFVYYDSMPSPSEKHDRVVLGRIPLLCCVVKTLITSSGEPVMALYQHIFPQGKKVSGWGSPNYRGRMSGLSSSGNSPGDYESPKRGRRKRPGRLSITRSSSSLSPPPSPRGTLNGISELGGERGSSLSPLRTRVGAGNLHVDVEYDNYLGVDAATSSPETDRVFYLRMDGKFGVRDGLEQLLRESSVYVTTVVFHNACSYSSLRARLSGDAAIEAKSKTALLAKNCFYFLAHAAGGSLQFLVDDPPGVQSRLTMGQSVQSGDCGYMENESFLNAMTQGSKTPEKKRRKAIFAAAKAINNSILQLLLGKQETADCEINAPLSGPGLAFFSRVFGRSTRGGVPSELLSTQPRNIDWSCVDVNMQDDHGNTALHILLQTANSLRIERSKEQVEETEALRCVMTLLEAGARVDITNCDDRTPLHFTSDLPPCFVAELISRGALPSTEDAQGVTPFSEWVRSGNVDVLSAVFHFTRENFDPIVAGTAGRSYSLVELVNSRHWMDGSTALWQAISGGHIRALSLLLNEGGADVNVRDFNWNTPLVHCASVFVECTRDNPSGVIETSALYHHCVVVLLNAGADVNARNIKGKSCLHILANIDPISVNSTLLSEPTFNVLFEAGADLQATSYAGYTPLHYAAMKGNWRLLKLLLDPSVRKVSENIKDSTRMKGSDFQRVDPNYRGPDGKTALDFVQDALMMEDSDKDALGKCVDVLLGSGAYKRIHMSLPVERDSVDMKFMSSGKTGNYMMKAGTVERVVERLTAYPRVMTAGAEDDRLCFLLQFDKSTTRLDLISTFLSRLRSIINSAYQSPSEEDAAFLNKFIEVVSFYAQWFSIRPDVLELSPNIAPDPTTSSTLLENRNFFGQFLDIGNILLSVVRSDLISIDFSVSDIVVKPRSSDIDQLSQYLADLSALLKSGLVNVDRCRFQENLQSILHVIKYLFSIDNRHRDGEDVTSVVYGHSVGEKFAVDSVVSSQAPSVDSMLSRPSLSYAPDLMKSIGELDDDLVSSAMAGITYYSLRNMVEAYFSRQPGTGYATTASRVTTLEDSGVGTNLMWGLAPTQMAQQLTLVMHALLCFIPPSEFLNGQFRNPSLSPNFTVLKQASNRIIFTLASEILSHNSESARAHVILYLIHTAECCYHVRNLESVVTIVTCLEMTAIYRLKRTWRRVEEASPGKWLHLKSLVGTGGRALDGVLRKLESPSVPTIGNILRHLVNLFEEPSYIFPDTSHVYRQKSFRANLKTSESLTNVTAPTERSILSVDDVEKPSDQQTLVAVTSPAQAVVEDAHNEALINFHKFRKIGKLVKTVYLSTVTLYPFECDFNVINRFFPPAGTSDEIGLRKTYDSEEECYNRSLILEEKESKEGSCKGTGLQKPKAGTSRLSHKLQRYQSSRF
mmetsp:Transcript_5067/g.7742  ORF Transcript_5067/g.7742 Transcript_5067/m.7742 type:complete len:1861 (+) Transcript_5067:138-5720(+)|eukprot:CAMPEP_0185034180 /NCGR_PEP_ID=MMETSP1103-20130426/23816_1 /TAXON_ID=36769 /ORGANISM="Paraphysomonas bandaiensis, Strain Caron Lab Isolate" /LENGTH=1860 /DNA_ID=CAMNT_0027570725 /DNA_START=64 /DNA_END=5646 /DNA_ORIENTATION=+